jgi:hypothetical protein
MPRAKPWPLLDRISPSKLTAIIKLMKECMSVARWAETAVHLTLNWASTMVEPRKGSLLQVPIGAFFYLLGEFLVATLRLLPTRGHGCL